MNNYLMENEDEALRLDLKIDERQIKDQALWAGIKPGMRIADIGSGSGTITYLLKEMAGPDGSVIGVDGSRERIDYAIKYYSASGIEYTCRDILEPLDDLGKFDFIWIRFVLQYYRSNSFDIVRNLSKLLKPGGIICMIDQDNNGLCHFGYPERLNKTIQMLMHILESRLNFDPFVGRKLYSYLYDLKFQNIDVNITQYNLIFGKLREVDRFNWMKKIEMIGENAEFELSEYKGGYEEFCHEFQTSFADPRRFFYTPLISCKGIKPSDM